MSILERNERKVITNPVDGISFRLEGRVLGVNEAANLVEFSNVGPWRASRKLRSATATFETCVNGQPGRGVEVRLRKKASHRHRRTFVQTTFKHRQKSVVHRCSPLCKDSLLHLASVLGKGLWQIYEGKSASWFDAKLAEMASGSLALPFGSQTTVLTGADLISLPFARSSQERRPYFGLVPGVTGVWGSRCLIGWKAEEHNGRAEGKGGGQGGIFGKDWLHP